MTLNCPHCGMPMSKRIHRVSNTTETWVHSEDNFECTVSRIVVHHMTFVREGDG